MEDTLYAQYLDEIRTYKLLTIEEEAQLAQTIKTRNQYDGEIPEHIHIAAQEAINTLVTSNLRLVVRIVNTISKRYTDKMDLISEGNRGLMRAAETFDPEKGAKFSVYSSFWVKQYINKFIYRSSDHFKLPDKVWSNKYRVHYFTEEYEHKHGMKPSMDEVAKALDISVNAVINVYDINRQVINLDASILDDSSDSTNGEILSNEDNKTPDNYIMSSEAERVVNELILELPPRERDIITRRYGLNGKKVETLYEVGVDHNLTQERIRQLEAACVKKMKMMLADRDIEHNPLGTVYI